DPGNPGRDDPPSHRGEATSDARGSSARQPGRRLMRRDQFVRRDRVTSKPLLATHGRTSRRRQGIARRLTALATSLLLVVLAGCATSPRHAPPPPLATEVIPLRGAAGAEAPEQAPVEAPSLRQIEPGSGVFINRQAARQPR